MRRNMFKPVLAFGLAVAVTFGSLGTGIPAGSTVEASGLSTFQPATAETLAQVTGVAYNAAKDYLYWNKVKDADSYVITLTDAEGYTRTFNIYSERERFDFTECYSYGEKYDSETGQYVPGNYWDYGDWERKNADGTTVYKYRPAVAPSYTVTVYAKSSERYIIATDVPRASWDSYTRDKDEAGKIYYDGFTDEKVTYVRATAWTDAMTTQYGGGYSDRDKVRDAAGNPVLENGMQVYLYKVPVCRTYYKLPVGPESAPVTVALPMPKAESETAISAMPAIERKEITNGAAVFRVTGDVIALAYEDERVEWQYSNNAQFTEIAVGTQYNKSLSTDKKWVDTERDSSDTPELYVGLDSLLPGETLYVRARVYNPNYKITKPDGSTQTGGYSAFSNVLSYKVPNPEVSQVTPYVTGSSITLSVEVDGAATGYQFAKKVNGKWVTLATQTDNTYEDTGLSKNTKYSYRVRGYYYNEAAKKTIYTEWENVEARTWTANLAFKADAASATSVKLSWKKVSGAEGYEIWRTDVSGGSLTSKKGQADSSYTENILVKNLGAKKTSYTDKKLVKGRSYTYFIRAYKTVDKKKIYIEDYAGVILDSHKIWVDQQYVTSAGKTVIVWSKITGIKGYYVEKKNDVTGVWDKVKTLKASATTYTFPKVNVGSSSVKYRIRPYDAKEVFAGAEYTINPTLAAVTGVKAKKTANGIQVSWNAVAGAEYYQVYRTTSSRLTYDATRKTYRVPGGASLVYEGNVNTADCHPETGGAAYVEAGTYRTDRIEGTSVEDKALTYQDTTWVWDAEAEEYKKVETGVDASGRTTYQTDVKYYYNVKGPEAGVKYYYYVVAYAEEPNGNVDYAGSICSAGVSKPVSATYTAVKAAKPGKVTVSSKKSAATIKITKVKGAKGYAVYRATKKGGKYVLVGLTTKTTFTDKNVTAGKTYYYKVASYVQSEAKANIYSSKTKAYKLKIKK